MIPWLVKPASAMYCVICVVLPLPVSPITTRNWLSETAATSSFFSVKIGSDSRCSAIDRLRVGKPKETAFPIDCCFHSGTASWVYDSPRSSCAMWRSPGSGIGSSHGRLRSFGIESIRARCCCSRSSRRSFASADCVIAARCSEPSGFLTTLIGLIATEFFVCPRRKSGSCSFSSISNSSSVFSTFISPASSSNCG